MMEVLKNCADVRDLDLLQPGLLHELFEHQADARPDATALVCAGARMSYGDLERRSNQLARLLRQRGVRRGDCVALWLPRSMEVLVALLGILKAGAAYVPLGPGISGGHGWRLFWPIAARAPWSPAACSPPVPAYGTAPSSPSRWMNAPRNWPPSPPPVCAPRTLAHRPATFAMSSTPREPPAGPRAWKSSIAAPAISCAPKGKFSKCARTTASYQGFSIAFDASVEEIWLAFFAGAALVVGTAEMVRAGAALAPLLAAAGVTVLSCVPTLAGDDGGGRALAAPLDSRRRSLPARPGQALVEARVAAWSTLTARPKPPSSPPLAECRPGKPVTIGRPLPNYFACILDDQLQPAAPGAAGELCLGGIGLARGYLGRPELTARKIY